MFDSFVSVCQSSAAKRKRVDVEACNVSGSESCSSSNSQISVKEGFSNIFKVRKAIYTQKEFDHYICNYIVDSVLPISHVQTESFKEFMEQLAPGNYQNISH
jgi:hypothetical protein